MKINLSINGVTLTLEVSLEEEQYYRKAAGLLNSLIGDYSNKYNNLTHQQLLTMVALDVAVNEQKRESELHQITQTLGDLL